jgi:hypothetical protein
MSDSEDVTRKLLESEARIWRSLTPADYDQAVCRVLDTAGTEHEVARSPTALLELATTILYRNEQTLTKSRACVAERLLALMPAVSDPVILMRIRRLFLLAWQQLALAVQNGGDTIAATPDLPPDVMLPYGADPAAIADPVLRGQAEELAMRHQEAVKRWTAKQHALDHLRWIVRAVGHARATPGGASKPGDDLVTAMTLSPGLPPDLQRLLREAGP